MSYNPNLETFRNMSDEAKEEYLSTVADNFTQIDASAMVRMLEGVLDGEESALDDVFNLYERIAQRAKSAGHEET